MLGEHVKLISWILLLFPFVIRGVEPIQITSFRSDATPPLGSPLCNGGVKPAAEISQPLHAIGLVLVVPKQKPIVLCAVDWTGIGNDSNKAWRSALAESAGTTPDRVAVHTLHQHDAPGCDFTAVKLLADYGLDELFSNNKHSRKVIGSTAAALKKAMGQLQPVTHAGFGRVKVEKFASNRRLLGPNGKVLHVRFSKCRKPEVRALPEGVIDPYVCLLSFRNNDKPLVILSYYATHPQSYYGQGGVNPNTVGIARATRAKAVLKDPRAGTANRIRAARDIAWARRVKVKDPIELTCLRLGNESILHFPGELFVEYQLAAQKMRPNDFVAMAAYGDYAPGYIGDAISYTQGGYETGKVSRVAPEVEGVLIPALKELLK